MRYFLNRLMWVGLFILAACAPSGDETAVILEPEVDFSVPVFERVDNLSAAESADAAPVLSYTVTGGLMGIGNPETVWTFYDDGRVEASDGRSWQLTAEEQAALLTVVESNNLDQLKATYMPEDTCCDRFRYTIGVYMENGKQQEVTALDGAEMPPALAQSLDAIQQLVSKLAEQQ